MDIESINVDSVNDLESAKKLIAQLVDCVFVMNKDIQRQISHLTSQNIQSIDFNITRVENIDAILNKYATKEYVNDNFTAKS